VVVALLHEPEKDVGLLRPQVQVPQFVADDEIEPGETVD